MPRNRPSRRKAPTSPRRPPPNKAEQAQRLLQALKHKASPADMRAMEMCHLQNLDAVATGQAGPQCMWDWAAGVLMFARVADALQAGQLEMQGQLAVATRLVERWARTGRVLFDGPDYQMARIGVAVMTELASQADWRTLQDAAHWGMQQVQLLTVPGPAADAQGAPA